MKTRFAAFAAAAIGAPMVAASTIDITIENTQGAGGLSFTPFWVGLHNGGFDSYDGGASAAGFGGLEELAELGQTAPISAAFSASAAGLAGGVDTTLANSNAAPVFSPGETQTFTLDAVDATINRYFSYASMIVPTNDLFVANGNPFAHEIFDAAGNFNGPVTISIFGRDVNDAGTEVNDADNGAAFLDGIDGQLGTAEIGAVVTNYFDIDTTGDYLDTLIGRTTVDGGLVSSRFSAGDLIARITIVPAPGTGTLAGLGLLAVARRRRMNG